MVSRNREFVTIVIMFLVFMLMSCFSHGLVYGSFTFFGNTRL